jgi:hypothetical protein
MMNYPKHIVSISDFVLNRYVLSNAINTVLLFYVFLNIFQKV